MIRGELQRLQILNAFPSYKKRAARIILQADYMTSSTYMFEELGWQTIPKRLLYNKAVFTFKALNNLTPSYISNLLKPMSESHALSLRSSNNGLLSISRFLIPHQKYGIHFLRCEEQQALYKNLRQVSKITYKCCKMLT